MPHPKLENTKFGDDGTNEDRHRLPHRDVLCRDRDFEHASVVKLTLCVGKYLSPAYRRFAPRKRKTETPPCGR